MHIDPSFAPYLNLVIALLLGSCLGLERSFAGKTAGLRTYGLVSMGSALFIIISKYVIPASSGYSFDPMRIAAGIVMGIGFLCGGVIVFRDQQLSGLTTAAGIWVAAGIGMAVGYGLVSIAIFATIATLIVFTLFWSVEQMMVRMSGRK